MSESGDAGLLLGLVLGFGGLGFVGVLVAYTYCIVDTLIEGVVDFESFKVASDNWWVFYAKSVGLFSVVFVVCVLVAIFVDFGTTSPGFNWAFGVFASTFAIGVGVETFHIFKFRKKLQDARERYRQAFRDAEDLEKKPEV